MKINRNSWHYRWANSNWAKDPKSLCTYFWKVVFTFLFYILGSISISLTTLAILFILFYPVLQIWLGVDLFIAVFSAILWVLLGSISLYHYRKYLYYSGKLTKIVHKEPGLVVQYLDAKHRKVCPLIDYVND